MADVPRGRFVWLELETTDPVAAQRFYPRVTGWNVDTTFPTYAMWKVGERPIGGCMELPAEVRARGVPPHWLGYVATPDVDRTLSEAQARGAQAIAGPKDEPNVGRWAVLADPQGAVLALFDPTMAIQTPAEPAEGDFSWHELATTDHEAAFEFYAGVFGWERLATHDMGPMGTYLIFGLDGRQLGGMYRKPEDMPAPPHWLHYVRVDSADDAARRITDAGGTILHGPADVPDGGRIAMAQDPQGAYFAVHASQAG